MDMRDMLGGGFLSSFTGTLDGLPQHVHYGPDAALRLAQSLAELCQGRRVAVLFDTRTRAAAGEEALRALRGRAFDVFECLIPDRADGRVPVCDDATRDALKGALPEADCMVAVGSGVVNDLTKWLAAEAGVPYGVLATAGSMNGYAAANVAPTLQGVKTLFRGRAPRVIAADPRVLAAAPHEMTTAGLGDLIAKPVSTADWRINHVLFGESYSPAIAALIDSVEPLYLDRPGAVAEHEPESIRALFEALVLSGAAMTLQGSSMPASGGEHLISHTLDMSSEVEGTGHDLHGRQVGVATIFAAALYGELLALDAPAFEVPLTQLDPSVWGAAARSVEAEFTKKRHVMARAVERLREPGVWARIREELRPTMRSPEKIKQCLVEAKGAHRISDIGCTRDRFLRAVRSCAWMRGRFTSIDLALCTGLIPGIEEKVVDRYLT